MLASLALGVGASAPVATAAETHRAAVIVDTGGSVHKVVITFTEDSITGIDALQRAGANPVIYAMGPGAAVCRLFGVGRDAGPNCLGGTDGDNNYWAYWRAPAGSGAFSYSRVGGGAAQVHDGDVEGWKFGTGSAPTYVSLASLTAPPPPPPTSRPPATTPPTKPPAGPGSTAAGTPGATTPAGSTVAGVVPPSSSTLPVTGPGAAKATAKTTIPGATTKTSTHDTKHSGDSDESAAGVDADGKTVNTALASSDRDSSSQTWSYVGLAVLLAAIVGAILLVRRRRKTVPPSTNAQ
jgi:hypothetical protein